jgi:hypothetical protein
MMAAIPVGMKFGAIMADPGIAFETYSPKGEGRSPQNYYRCDSFEYLAALPISDFASEDCFLFLWIPPRSVYLTKPLMEATTPRIAGYGGTTSRSGDRWPCAN